MQIEHRHTLRKQNGASSKKSVAVAFLPGKNHSNQCPYNNNTVSYQLYACPDRQTFRKTDRLREAKKQTDKH